MIKEKIRKTCCICGVKICEEVGTRNKAKVLKEYCCFCWSKNKEFLFINWCWNCKFLHTEMLDTLTEHFDSRKESIRESPYRQKVYVDLLTKRFWLNDRKISLDYLAKIVEKWLNKNW